MKLDHQNKYRLNSKTAFAIITMTYLGLSLYLYMKYGVKIMNDSPRYLVYAENLSEGVYFDPLNFWYISYVFFVAFVKLFSDSHTVIIIVQYVLGYVAVLALFGATKRLTGSTKIAFLAGMIFVLFPDNLMWHSYVLTESFYCSVLCFTLYFLVVVNQKPSILNYVKLGIVLVICFFSKPTSPALFIALAFPTIWSWLRNPPYQLAKFASLAIAGIGFLFLANKMISSHRVMLIYEKGDIIFAMHEFPTHPHHDWMTVDVPDDLYKPPIELPLLQQMGEFVVSNPWYFSKLFIGKMVMFISHIRTYWSLPHNLGVIVTLWPLYFFSVRAIRKREVPNYLATGSVIYFIVHTLVVSSTWADWDGRFFVPLIPIVVLVGTIGIAKMIRMIPQDLV